MAVINGKLSTFKAAKAHAVLHRNRGLNLPSRVWRDLDVALIRGTSASFNFAKAQTVLTIP